MIDERALDLGFQEYDRVMASPEMTELEAFRKAIEAYEAAKWRPIDNDTKSEGAVLIWPGKRNAGITWPSKNIAYYGNGKWNTNCNDENLWHVSTFGAHGGQFKDGWLIEEGAMFCKVPLIKGR